MAKSSKRRSKRRSHKRSSKKRSYKRTPTRGCPRGYIRRTSYTRKSYTRKSGSRVRSARIKSNCIKMTGKHGLRVIPKLRKGELSKFGYSSSASAGERHKALTKAVKAYGSTSTFRKVNVLATLNKNRNPVLAKKFKSDANWIRENHM